MIQLPPESNLIKFMQHGFMEAFANAVCLWMQRFGLGVFYAIDAKVQFIIMRFDLAAVFRAPYSISSMS